eukprot:CAMPEP_0174319112 /NCGR_PEP_ID=MMETSP0810-20121108/8648_1 /TAXON_ID=73025 ORGANISM="Eutreptiella gymnastica-like, Strain CCMP1594" /NCGR_SAMPLE_ID=MMETSP0810 /ASSEMBLY_ACC=CAM_ASM_000659 /LENGTH=80 /DNA_ID=CAMNT_0015429547 /DNA_START=782 /DNA_END=1024 /DNA_ORIENTATION=-
MILDKLRELSEVQGRKPADATVCLRTLQTRVLVQKHRPVARVNNPIVGTHYAPSNVSTKRRRPGRIWRMAMSSAVINPTP